MVCCRRLLPSLWHGQRWRLLSPHGHGQRWRLLSPHDWQWWRCVHDCCTSPLTVSLLGLQSRCCLGRGRGCGCAKPALLCRHRCLLPSHELLSPHGHGQRWRLLSPHDWQWWRCVHDCCTSPLTVSLLGLPSRCCSGRGRGCECAKSALLCRHRCLLPSHDGHGQRWWLLPSHDGHG